MELAGAQIAAIGGMIALFVFAVWFGASRSGSFTIERRREDPTARDD